MTPRLRTDSQCSINLPSITIDGTIVVGIRDTFSSLVLNLFTRRSFISSQVIFSEEHSKSSKLEVGLLMEI